MKVAQLLMKVLGPSRGREPGTMCPTLAQEPADWPLVLSDLAHAPSVRAPEDHDVPVSLAVFQRIKLELRP
jgi:hypothetical protein